MGAPGTMCGLAGKAKLLVMAFTMNHWSHVGEEC